MATYDLVYNIAKGRGVELALNANAVIAIPIATAGIVSAATMRDYATLAAILAANTEQTTMGRKTLTGVAALLDQSGDANGVDANDITWTAAGGAAISAIVIAAKPASGSTDAQTIPLVCLDAVATPAGGDITAQLNAQGFFRAV